MDHAYRRLCSRLGAAMLCHLLLINLLMSGVLVMLELALLSLDDRDYNLIYQITYSALYLAAFMLPVAFFRILDRDSAPTPMEMSPRMEWRSLLYIFAVLGVNMPCAYLNGYFVSFLESIGLTDIVAFSEMPLVYPEDSVLLHMSLALVPAFCEEFFFRGLICRRLMPYGKTAAILGSAVLFGLMHGNITQLFYTTMAGIMLGWCYVETRSIWPGVIAHMLNNLTGFVAEMLYDRLPLERAGLYDFIIASAIVLIGLICFVAILRGRRHDAPLLGLGNTRPLTDAAEVLPMPVALRGFLRPTVVVYVVLSVGGILTYLLLGTVMAMTGAALPN